METEFSNLVKMMNKGNIMKEKKSGGKKNAAIKSGNPAFKPTNNGSTVVKGAKDKLNNKVWRGTPRGK